MMGDVLDAFLLLLANEPADRLVVLGTAPDGRELRVGRHVDRMASTECSSVFVEVPEASRGRVFVVLSRWSDEGGTLAYSSPQGGAETPRWKRLELVPGGVRLSVRWHGEETDREYEFAWLPTRVQPWEIPQPP